MCSSKPYLQNSWYGPELVRGFNWMTSISARWIRILILLISIYWIDVNCFLEGRREVFGKESEAGCVRTTAADCVRWMGCVKPCGFSFGSSFFHQTFWTAFPVSGYISGHGNTNSDQLPLETLDLVRKEMQTQLQLSLRLPQVWLKYAP